jgi:hypothetical protein
MNNEIHKSDSTSDFAVKYTQSSKRLEMSHSVEPRHQGPETVSEEEILELLEKYNKDREYQLRHTGTEKEPTVISFPDPKLHKYVSFAKSGVRLLACIFGVAGSFLLAFTLLALAEIIGIFEETV